MNGAALGDAARRVCAEMVEANEWFARTQIDTRDHPEGVDLNIGVSFSWGGRQPVICITVGQTFRSDADPEECANNAILCLAAVCLGTVTPAKKFRRRAKALLYEGDA